MSIVIKSDDIQVFPSTYRVFSAKGKFTSESNFTNILNSINDHDSYVIRYPDDITKPGVLELIINGYYFIYKNFKKDDSTLYVDARIRVETGSGSLVDYSSGTGTLDSGSEFKGLYFGSGESYSDIAGTEVHVLPIISGGEFIKYYKTRISSESIYYNESKNLKDELDTKQLNLSAGEKIVISNVSEENKDKISLNSDECKKLDSLSKTSLNHLDNGSLLYFNSAGEACNSQITLGGPKGDNGGWRSDNGVRYNCSEYLNSGKLAEGPRMYYSKESPNDGHSTLGRVGDFWFKYSDQ